MPHVSEFFTSWMAIFSHSSKAKIMWKEQMGKSMLSYSSTRRWSKWEILKSNYVLLVMYMFFFRIIQILDQLLGLNFFNFSMIQRR